MKRETKKTLFKKLQTLFYNLFYVKDHGDYETFHAFRIRIFKKKKSQIRKIYDLLNWQKDRINLLEDANKRQEAKLNQIAYQQRILIKEPYRCVNTLLLHQKTFPKYKNIHQGKSVVILACGPTLNDYKPMENVVHIGVNISFLNEKVPLDFLFCQDFFQIQDYQQEIIDYKGNNCKKFFGLASHKIKRNNIPECLVTKANAERFQIYPIEQPPYFTLNIDSEAFGCQHSIVFHAMQFALWTNPAKIYLVGCDCSNKGYYNGGQQPYVPPTTENGVVMQFANGWQAMKEFANLYYPETEIISINPVGLKGLFQDIYM
ncbi:MAG TPA: hypothetical protein PKI94_03590 [Candidatus Gastranaerophilaceae bacterium]|nr:hypothetical protein [Candidatus Gastranaerophilaceae bacterium]